MPKTNMRDTFTNIQDKPAVQTGTKPTTIARNTWRYTRPDGTVCIRLHFTDIVEVLPDGQIRLDSGGYKTMTTKDRLNSFSPASVYSVKGTWHVSFAGQSCPFFDGMVLPDAFASTHAAKIPEKEAKLKAQIKKFVCDTIPLNGELPKPDNGDCWFCAMFDAEPPATREGNGHTVHTPRPDRDSSHLREHIKEKYMTGSLIVNALRANGIADTGIGYYLSSRFGDNARVRSTVRKYIGKRLGLAV